MEHKQIEKTHKHLYSKVIYGGAWTVAIRVFVQLMSLGRYIVFARILGRSGLGLLGIALLMINVLNRFTSTGFNAALIQKKEDIGSYLNTVWTVGVLRSIILFAIMYFIAPFLAMIKVAPDKVDLTIDIIRAMALTLVIGSFANIAMIYFKKELQFGKLFFFNIASTLIDVVVAVTVAVIYRSPWALVAGKFSSVVLAVLVSYYMHSYRPRFALDLGKARELWRFGRWLFRGSILGFLINEGDDFFVWCYLGIADLGTYLVSFKFALLPTTEITNVISNVTFPAYSKVQDDIKRLREAYLKTLEFSAFFSVPAAALILCMAPEFVRLFLTGKLGDGEWLSAIPVIQILSVRGLVCSIGATRGPLFLAAGKPELGVKIQRIKLVLLAAMIYPLTKNWGIAGTALSIVVADLLLQPMAFMMTVRLVQSSIGEMLRPIVFSFVAATAMAATIFAYKFWVFDGITYWSFAITAVIGMGTYVAVSFLLERFCGYRIRHIIQETFAVFRNSK